MNHLIHKLKQQGAIALLLSLSLSVKAQDARFTQYYASPQNLNPALTGKGVEDWRATALYRNQNMADASSVFATYGFAIEKNLYTSAHGGQLAFGASMLGDASNYGLLKTTGFSGALAYNIALSSAGKQLLGVGVQYTYANRAIDATKLLYQDGSTGAADLSGTAVHYSDLAAGIHYSAQFERSNLYIGGSIYHLNQPKMELYSGNPSYLDPRYSIQAGYGMQLSGNNELLFSGAYDQQLTNSLFSAGALYKIGIQGATLSSINVGLWDRFGKFLSPYVGIESKGEWLLGLSTDIKTGSEPQLKAVQSFELGFGLKFGSRHQGEKKAPVLFF